MRYLQTSVYIGFILCALSAVYLLPEVRRYCLESWPDSDQVVYIFGYIRQGAYISLLLQVLGVAFIVLRHKAGAILATVGSMIFMPLSVIFLIGCLEGADKWKYEHFEKLPSLPEEGIEIRFGFMSQFALVILSIAAGLGFIFMAQPLGLTFLGVGILQGLQHTRVSSKSSLAFYKNGLIIKPGAWTAYCRIPYAKILGMREERNRVTLTVDLPDSQGKYVGNSGAISVNFALLPGEQRARARETLREALRKHCKKAASAA